MMKNKLYLSFLIVICFSLWIILSSHITHPFIFPDENIYTQMSRSFWYDGNFSFRGKGQDIPSILYPVITSPVWILDNPQHRILVYRVINSLCILFSAIPVYWILALVVPQKRRLATLAAILVLPGWMYAGTHMAENIYYPLFLCVIASIFSYLVDRTHIVLIVIFALLSFYAKPHILLLTPGYLLTAGILFVHKDTRIAQKLLKATMALFAGPVTYILWHGIFHNTGMWKTWFIGSQYNTIIRGMVPFSFVDFSIAIVCLGFLCCMPLLFFPGRSYRLTNSVSSLFRLMTICTCVSLVFLIAYFTVTHGEVNRVHERYLFPIIPLIIISVTATNVSSHKRWLYFLFIIIMVIIGTTLISSRADWPISTDSPTLVAFFTCKLRYNLFPGFVIAGFILISSVTAVLLSRNFTFSTWCMPCSFLVLTLLSFYGYKTIDSFQEQKGGAFRKWIAENIPPTTYVAYVIDGYGELLRQRCYMSEMYANHDTRVITTKTEFDQTGEGALVMMNGLHFEQKPAAHFEDSSLYFISFSQGAVLNPDQ